jgi:hypothetical protein
LFILVNCWSSLFKLSFVFVYIGGIVDHHCLNFLLFCWYWWLVDHHCLNFLLFCWYQQFTNINKTKESLNSNDQQFHQYKQNKRNFKQWSTIHQYQQNKRKFKQWWFFVLFMLVELLIITV